MPLINDFVVTESEGNTVIVAFPISEIIQINGETLDTTNQTGAEVIEKYSLSLNDNNDKHKALNWLQYIDPTFSFTTDAALFQVNSKYITTGYFLWLRSGCEGLIDNDCKYTNMENNGHPQGAMSLLDEMFNDSEWNGQDSNELLATTIAWGESGALKVEFIGAEASTGLVNFYYQKYSENLVRKIAYGQWQREQIMGTEVVLLASEWIDTDVDGVGNNQDEDDDSDGDGDGVADEQDLAPLNNRVTVALDFTPADISAE